MKELALEKTDFGMMHARLNWVINSRIAKLSNDGYKTTDARILAIKDAQRIVDIWKKKWM